MPLDIKAYPSPRVVLCAKLFMANKTVKCDGYLISWPCL